MPAFKKTERESAQIAREVIERMIPEREQRLAWLRLLGDCIDRAAEHGSQVWSVTLKRKGCRLNVGRFLVIDTVKDPTWIFVQRELLNEDLAGFLDEHAERGRPLRSLEENPTYLLPRQRFFEALPRLHDALVAFVDVAAGTAKKCPYMRSHSPGVLEYLEQELGRALPRPSTGGADGGLSVEEALSELSELYESFIAEYWNQPKGAKHRELVEAGNRTGRENWALVQQGIERGEDVTDLVLDGLLPHLNSTGNRERGAWVHVAPAVTKDVRGWFEGVGWTKARDWPKVALAIYELVRRCVEDPDDTQAACEEFTQLPVAKGFQTGMLTPILNALRPEDFLVINGKTTKVLRHYTGTELRARMEDYAAYNELAMEFVESCEEFFEREETRKHPPGELFDTFCHWLVAETEQWPVSKRPDAVQYWKIAPGKNAALWEECREGGHIAIGWPLLGDLSQVDRAEFDRRVKDISDDGNDIYTVTGTNMVWNFTQIPVGSYIVANRGHSEVLGAGRVVGPYEFEEGSDFPHRLPVRWYDTTVRPIDQRGWNMTMVNLRSPEKLRELGVPLEVKPARVASKAYPLVDCAEETGFKVEELERWVRAIERKKQAILYGPPGTGKTYIAERLARHLVGDGEGVVELVQFHPSYAYEDFLQGLRPTRTADGGLAFELVQGRFLEFCARAGARSGTSVLIIDEINRANLSRVFGELMYLLEYRDREMPLAGGGNFRIPKQVRVIGTMNTADRSIALVDHALRRRFAFLALQPRFEVLESYHERTGFQPEGLVSMLRRVNQAINDPNYEVGISFFLREDLDRELGDIWRLEIVPYLEEYFFDQAERVDEFHWERVRDVVMP